MLALGTRPAHRDAARALLLEPPTLTPLLQHLEAIGYLRRERSTEDGWELRVVLAPARRGLLDDHLEAAAAKAPSP